MNVSFELSLSPLFFSLKVNQRVTKKNSVDEDFFDIEGVENAPSTAPDVVDGIIGAKSPQISTTTSSTNSRPSVSNSASTSSARSGSLSEEGFNSSRRRAVIGQAVASRGSRDNLIGGSNPGSVAATSSQQPQSQPQTTMSQSMPATILNLEENRVTIQVPGVQSSSVQPRTSQHPTVVKQSSADKGTFDLNIGTGCKSQIIIFGFSLFYSHYLS